MKHKSKTCIDQHASPFGWGFTERENPHQFSDADFSESQDILWVGSWSVATVYQVQNL